MSDTPMSVEEHQVRHQVLHGALDELLADYILHHPLNHGFLAVPILTLLDWSHAQQQTPTEVS